VPPSLPTFRRWLDARCAAAAERTFLEFRGERWSYGDLRRVTDAIAARLHRLGVVPGDRVAIRLPNSPEHVFAWLAAAKLGATVAPLHAQWTNAEVDRALTQLRPKLLVSDLDQDKAKTFIEGKVEPRPLPMDRGVSPSSGSSSSSIDGSASVSSSFPSMKASSSLFVVELGAVREWLRGDLDGDFPDVPEVPADAPAELLFTSGTTGLPKAAVQSFRSMRLTGEAFADWLGLASSDRLFTCLPLAHVNARFYSTLGALAAGAALVLEERFSASAFWRWMAESRATEVNTIGAMLRILLQAPESDLDRAHDLRLVYTSPALGAEHHRAFEARFGVRLVVGYGMTECTFGFIHPLDLPLESPERRLDSMGRPRRHPDPRWPCGWKLIDPATGAESNAGEIHLSGPTVFSGYFENPAATASVARADGWLATGDLATRDPAGWYTFVGRTKEMIRRRGENLSPLEVEEVLMSHPAVAEAAVVGVPAELGDEEVAAFVVLRRECLPECGEIVEALATWCAAHLASFKVPSEWRLLDELPRTSTNRVAKAELLKLRT
jgi:crotonobetaine/carnitine-CoA ligase